MQISVMYGNEVMALKCLANTGSALARQFDVLAVVPLFT